MHISIDLARRTPAHSWERKQWAARSRSEEHTSELQSQSNLVCRLLLEKKTQRHSIAPRRRARRALAPAPPNTAPLTAVGAGTQPPPARRPSQPHEPPHVAASRPRTRHA